MKYKGTRCIYALLVLALTINILMFSSCSQPQGVTKEQYETVQKDLTAAKSELEKTKADLAIYKARLDGIKETWIIMVPKMQIADALLENFAVWGKIRGGQTTFDENQVKFGNEWTSMSAALTQLNDADLKTALEKMWYKGSDNAKWNQDQAAFFELFRKQINNDWQKLSGQLKD